jgi:anti-anti-sigma factor
VEVPEFYRVQPVQQSISVIELALPESIDVLEFDHLNQSMLDLLNDKAHQPWVLDLTAVTYMGSAMLGLIINIRQRIKTAGGRLVVCGLSGRLVEIFRTSSMERLFTITRNRNEAINVLGG